MRKFFSSGEKTVNFIFIALALILVLRLFVLSVVQNDEWSSNADSIAVKGIYTASPRGNIYDRNGKLIAGNKQIFSVKMSSGNMENDEINRVATELISILEKNGDEYSRNFPIEKKNGKYVYSYDEERKKWLKENDIPVNSSAEKAFSLLKMKYGIDEDDRYKAMEILQTTYNIYPPIYTKNMEYKSEVEIETFLTGYGLDGDLTAEEAFRELRKDMEIDDSVSDSFAMKIMDIRTELKAMGYKKYLPATIAKDVSQETIMEVEENSDSLTGVDVISETKRYYPGGNFASHIIGYMGQIAPGDQAEYEEKGYAASSMIGKEGIERVYESVLKGQDGTQIVRVDKNGNYVETLQEIPAEKGRDIYLTIDSDLQKVAEDALERNIKAAQTGSTFESRFGDIGLVAAPRAESGAVVAVEVETGEILALANYPDYDPNLFAEGISSEDWESLQSENPRDSLSPAPLYNMATLTAVQPGSTYKPLTALAALECGLDPDKIYKDEGVIKTGDRTFGCVAYNTNGGNHGYLDLYKAIQVSCNYYFYELITNKNWSSGGTMGLSDEMGIEKTVEMGERFGLGKPTGIELSETVVSVPSEEKKIKSLAQQLKYVLYANAEEYFTEDVYSNSKRLDKDIETMSSWVGQDDMTYSRIKDTLLPTVGVKTEKYDEVTELILYTYIYQAEWGIGDAFNISIGQGDHAYTPIQIARYLAALGNEGTLNELSLVKSIEAEGDMPQKETEDTGVSQEYIDDVLEGMHRVTVGSDSGISSHYINFPWKACGKTGTAQKSGRINPSSETEYIREHLSSFGNMSWSSVEKEMKRLMRTYPETYTSEDVAVRRAVINLSGGKLTSEDLDRFKPKYDEFAWTMVMAPMEDPKIAVVCIIPQGVTGGNADPVVREIIGTYLESLEKTGGDSYSSESGIN